jgi:hypothetical protein
MSAEMVDKHRKRTNRTPNLWTCDVCGCTITDGLIESHIVGKIHLKKKAKQEQERLLAASGAGGSGNASELPAAANKVNTTPAKKQKADSAKPVSVPPLTEHSSADKVQIKPLNSAENPC